MRTSESIAKLATALSAAQADMKDAPLNRTNPHFRSKYADLPSVRGAVQAALAKHKLSVSQCTDFEGERFVLCTRLMHAESGEWIEGVYPLPMAADKPQAIGSAISYARRYTLAAICGIAADEDDDANAAHEAPQQRQQVRQRAATPFDDAGTDRKMADQLRAMITATRSIEDLDAVKRSPDFTATWRSLPDAMQKEIAGLGAEHREHLAAMVAQQDRQVA